MTRIRFEWYEQHDVEPVQAIRRSDDLAETLDWLDEAPATRRVIVAQLDEGANLERRFTLTAKMPSDS